MALSAAKSDLTLSMTGEDETAQMLMDAKDRVEALEGKLKSLKQAGDAQAAAAQKQSTALGAVNSRMVTVSKSATNVIEGFDKTAGAIGKVTATLGFWGAAITGAVALGSELISMLSATSGEVARLEGELAASKKGADEFATSMREMTTAIAGAQISSNNLATSTATLRSKMAALRGDLVGAEFERRQAEQLALAGQILDTEAKMAESRAAQTKAMEQAAKAQAQVEEGTKKEAALRKDIQNAELDRKLGLKTQDAEILHLKSLQLQQTIGENKENKNILAGAERRTKELDTQVESLVEQKNLMREIMGLMQGQKFEVPGATDPDKPPKPRGGGGGPAKETEREKRDRELRQEKERRQQEIRMNREFTAQVLENARIRDERLEAEAKAQKEAAEARRKLAQEQALSERMSDAKPVLDFASALTSNLVPALSEVQGLMDEVTNIFDKFTEGQTSMTQALGQGAMEIAAFAAKSIGGVKAEAAVRAIYEGAMGFATLATPAISAGHFTAAAMLAGVATGVIGGGGASASASASKGIGKPSASTGASTGGGSGNGGPVTNVYNLTAGVIDGQSTTRAFRRAELQSRGSGFATAGGW
jgi:hypothetical protein